MTGHHMTAEFFGKALRDVAAVHVGDPAARIRDGAADSRRVQPGDLFAGFRGETDDGNRYLEAAFERGAAAIIGERAPSNPPPDRSWAVASDSRTAIAQLARAWRTTCNPRVVGITGTVGKTTAKEMTAAVLGQHFTTHRSKENFNSREGLPLALASLRRDHQVSVLEMAMDSEGEIAELCAIARPDIGAVLNIGLTHVSKLGSIDAIAREKLSLVRSLGVDGTAILNADDPRVAAVAPELGCAIVSFGEAASASLRRGPIDNLGLEGCVCEVHYNGSAATLRTRLPGAHVVPAALCAVASAIALDVPFTDAVASVGMAEVEGRLRILRTDSGVTILDDRYNSSPASLEGALRLLGGLTGRRVAVVGTMAELGDHADSEHRRIGKVAASCCDILYATGDPCRVLVDAAQVSGLDGARWFESKDDLVEAIRHEVRGGDTVLVKASRSLAFETLIPVLEGAG